MAAPCDCSHDAGGNTALMRTSSSSLWRSIAVQLVMGSSSSGAFLTSSATIRASAPLTDRESAARVQKSISGLRLISVRKGKPLDRVSARWRSVMPHRCPCMTFGL
jgi:hypothetical protein